MHGQMADLQKYRATSGERNKSRFQFSWEQF